MNLTLFVEGLLIGFSIAAPVGPIGILCMRRTVAEGRMAGFVSGLGAATADALYGSIAAFGLTIVSDFLVHHHLYLQAIGGFFLLAMGTRIFLGRHIGGEPKETSNNLLGNYASTFFLTLTNPMTILSFVAIFAGLGIGNPQKDYLHAMTLIMGVFLGSATWWLMLSSGIGIFRKTLSASTLTWINRISGCIVVGFGVLALMSVMLGVGL